MKHLFFILLIVGFGVLTHAQTQYEVSGNGDQKIVKGVVTKYLLENDPSFAWFNQNKNSFQPGESVQDVLHQCSSNIELIYYGATWSDKSKQALPIYYSLLEKSSFDSKCIHLVMLDSNFHSIDDKDLSIKIRELPEIVVLKNGKLVGRVIADENAPCWTEQLGKVIKTAL